VYVVGSVPLLHPEAQTVDEMLEGWRNQQLCRNLDHDTIAGRVRLVERFIEHTNESRGRGRLRWLRSSSASALGEAAKAVDGAALPECSKDPALGQ